jgi:hypothetical protein
MAAATERLRRQYSQPPVEQRSAPPAARYIADLPEHLIRDEGQVRFEYVASVTETLFRDHADPAGPSGG